MLSIIAGTILLAVVHSLIPNHWLPLVAVARAEKWTLREMNTVTFLSALAHVCGTVVLGLVLGVIGSELEEKYGTAINVATSLMLIIFGLVYYTVNLPHHHHRSGDDNYKRSKGRWIFIFVIMMFLSPCLEVESLFLSAGAYGMGLVVMLSVIYAIVSITGIIILVNLGYKGVNLFRANFIEHNEKKISGIVLIIVGIASFFLH